MSAADRSGLAAQSDLDAFFRGRDDVPKPPGETLLGSLGRLRRSDDPVVAFAGLPAACVPAFADGCHVELSDGAEPLLRVAHPATAVCPPPAGPGSLLLTPFQVASGTGHPSYGGVVTHWWAGRAPSAADATIAGLIVGHVVALIDRERLMAAVARAEELAASLALRAVSGRTISIATGVVVHQHQLGPDEAGELLRACAREQRAGLPEIAAAVVLARSLGRP
jgi:hypothetical protein